MHIREIQPKVIQVGDKKLGLDVFLIAEIGSNHCQSLSLAKETIQAAKESGADAVKLQSLSLSDLYLNPSNSIVELHKKIDLPSDFFVELKDFCDKQGIVFFSSPTYLESVDFLCSLNVELFKIASAQSATFPQLITKVAKTFRPILLSTGLSTYSEIQATIKKINEFHKDYVILHCNSLYPTPASLVNLGRMVIYQYMFNSLVGFSDHTEGYHIAIAAVAMGAKVIEKHFILDKTLQSPDASVSLSPEEFKSMSKSIKDVEVAIAAEPRLCLEADEARFVDEVRYKLVVQKSKSKGDSLEPSDFSYKRTKGGIDCSLESLVVDNFVLKSDISSGTLLEFSMLEGKL